MIALLAFFCGAFLPVKAQSKLPGMDKSPLDFAYMPHNFPHDGGTLVGRVIYSRPSKNDRAIFGELIKYDKVWRVGANEATEIEFYKDVTFGGKSLKAGRYALYAIPGKDKWTFIVNSELHKWGAYSYDESKDVLRTEASVEINKETVEVLTIRFDDSGMHLYWDTTHIVIPVSH